MNCVKCGEIINPLRLQALPNTKICIECAEVNVKRKVGITTIEGQGDHTYNDLIIVEENDIKPKYEDRLNEEENA